MSELDEDVLAKRGPELFHELLRVYPDAELEDYFRAGLWKEDLLRTDLSLVWAHRREAGAPDPPDLEDVPMPELPKPPAGYYGARGMGGMGVVPGSMLAGGAIPGQGMWPGAVLPAGLAGGVRPGLPKATMVVHPSTAAASGPAAELKLIALFIAKWKLDPTKTKMLLAKMTPAKRRFVITNFKNTASAADSTAMLEQYIGQCEMSNSWEVPSAAGPASAGLRPQMRPGLAGAPGGLPAGMASAQLPSKRPLSALIGNPFMDASKRPRMMMPGSGLAQEAAAHQMGMASRMPIRPATPKAQEPAGTLIRSLLQKF